MNNCISKKDTKAVYKDGNTVRKVFAPDYSKTDVLYEALNTARVEDTGLDIPKYFKRFRRRRSVGYHQ